MLLRAVFPRPRYQDKDVSPDDELEQLLKLLIERYGPGRTLAEIYASTRALHLSREGRTMSMAEFAVETGISKKNLSRWAGNAIRKQRLKVRAHAEDGRRKDFALVDSERSSEHLQAVADLLGVRYDPPRRK